VPIGEVESDVTPKLLESNLIGGVIDASAGAVERLELR
jgi:hypothetical protein